MRTRLFIKLCHDLFIKEIVHSLGTYRIKSVFHRYADSLLTFSHTECARKFNAVPYLLFGNKLLKPLDNLPRPLNMTFIYFFLLKFSIQVLIFSHIYAASYFTTL